MSWIRGYLLVLRWNALSIKLFLPIIAVVQALLAVGVVVGFAFFLPSIDSSAALYLATGAPTMILISVGLVFMPQGVSEAKTKGSFGYTLTWPVPRLAMLAADATLWVLASLPGILVALIVAALRFDIEFQVTPLVVPAFLLVALTTVGVGYAIAYLLPPMLTNLTTQVIVFASLLFSPINFPADRLPNWLATVHDFLPMQYMAEVVRGTLVHGTFEARPVAFLVLGLWCIVGFIATYVAMARRR